MRKLPLLEPPVELQGPPSHFNTKLLPLRKQDMPTDVPPWDRKEANCDITPKDSPGVLVDAHVYLNEPAPMDPADFAARYKQRRLGNGKFEIDLTED